MFIGCLNTSVKVQKVNTRIRDIGRVLGKKAFHVQMQRATGSSLVNEEFVCEKQRYYLRVCTHAHVIIPN